jgi:hypothetical protein
VEEHDFAWALRHLKAGDPVSREGWNGKGMFIYLVGAGRYISATAVGQMIANEEPDGRVPYRPYIAMKTAQGDVVPWVASQSDLLAVDWMDGPNG